MSAARGRLSACLAGLCALGTAAAAWGATAAVSPRAVGSVTGATGTGLFVERAATGALLPLRTGTTLYLHDIVAAGPGGRATIRLLPGDAALPADADVLYVFKQLTAAEPTARTVGKEFGIAAAATRRDRTLTLRRAGSSVFITLSP